MSSIPEGSEVNYKDKDKDTNSSHLGENSVLRWLSCSLILLVYLILCFYQEVLYIFFFVYSYIYLFIYLSIYQFINLLIS